MTRTARKNTKKEPLPATPWEELSMTWPGKNETKRKALRKAKNQGLKVTQKNKLGPDLPAKLKRKLKSLTRTKVESLLSGDVPLVESPQSQCEETREDRTNGVELQVQQRSKKHKKRKIVRKEALRNILRGRVDNESSISSSRLLKKHRKRAMKSTKRRIICEDRQQLLRRSESDSSLSDQGETLPGGDSEGEGGGEGEESSLSDQVEIVPYEGEEDGEGVITEGFDEVDGRGSDGWGGDKEEVVEDEQGAKVTSQKKRKKEKKKPARVRIGKRWMKAKKDQSSEGQQWALGNDRQVMEGRGGDGWKRRRRGTDKHVMGGKDEEREREGEGAEGVEVGGRRKRKLGIDEDRRKKRIEQRRLRRQRKKVCFNCRQPDHRVGDCPLNSTSAGVCFKCGSSEHTCHQCRVKIPSGEFPYAKCFICGEEGHLSRSCPDNPRGLYPRGGGCKVCGSVEHLRANCPNSERKTKEPSGTAVSSVSSSALASADAEDFTASSAIAPPARRKLNTRKREKFVKF